METLYNDQVRVQPTESSVYTTIIKSLMDKNTEFHAYKPKQGRIFRVVLKNIHPPIDLNGIKQSLTEVRNEEVLLRANEQRNILHEIRKRKANWIGHILRRNCLVKQIIEGKIKGQIEVTRRRGRRRKKLLDDLKDRRGYCQLKEEALDRTKRRNHFGRSFGPVV